MRHSPLFPIVTCLTVLTLLFAGCQSRKPDYTPHLTRVYLEESSRLPAQQTVDMVLPLSETHIVVRGKPSFAEWDFLHATYFETDLGPAVVFLLTPEATRDLYRLSLSNQGKRLVITINGTPVGARYIDQAIEDGRITAYIEIQDEDIPEFVRNIQLTSQDIQGRQGRRTAW